MELYILFFNLKKENIILTFLFNNQKSTFLHEKKIDINVIYFKNIIYFLIFL
jgi:hypothetical protein